MGRRLHQRSTDLDTRSCHDRSTGGVGNTPRVLAAPKSFYTQ